MERNDSKRPRNVDSKRNTKSMTKTGRTVKSRLRDGFMWSIRCGSVFMWVDEWFGGELRPPLQIPGRHC